MTRELSKEKRRAQFLKKAGQMFEEMEDWYDQHPEASFGEIETKSRQERRELMGEAKGLLAKSFELAASVYEDAVGSRIVGG